MNPQGHSPALPRGGLSLTTTTVNELEVLAREPCSMFITLLLGSSKRIILVQFFPLIVLYTIIPDPLGVNLEAHWRPTTILSLESVRNKVLLLNLILFLPSLKPLYGLSHFDLWITKFDLSVWKRNFTCGKLRLGKVHRIDTAPIMN